MCNIRGGDPGENGWTPLSRLREQQGSSWRVAEGGTQEPGTQPLMGPLFPTGSRKLEYGGQTWHEHCFLCSGCEQPLGSRSFVPDKGAHYCVPCYENKFAPRCARCSKVGAAWSSTALGRG